MPSLLSLWSGRRNRTRVLSFKGSATLRCFALTLCSRCPALAPRFTRLEVLQLPLLVTFWSGRRESNPRAFIQGLRHAPLLRPHAMLALPGARSAFHPSRSPATSTASHILERE